MKIFENLSLDNLDGEIWKEINGYNGDYFISNLGRIKSFKKCRGISERILKQGIDSCGYLRVNLSNNGKEEIKRVHKLVYEIFTGKPLISEFIHHKDKNKLNNFLDNLELIDRGKHSKKHNKGIKKLKGIMYGEKSPNHKLTEKDIIEIKIDLNEGILTQKEIAKRFGVDQTTVSLIKNNKIWKNLN